MSSAFRAAQNSPLSEKEVHNALLREGIQLDFREVLRELSILRASGALLHERAGYLLSNGILRQYMQSLWDFPGESAAYKRNHSRPIDKTSTTLKTDIEIRNMNWLTDKQDVDRETSCAATKKHIFLSYCHSNREQVAQLRQDLVQAGETVWWDENILPGSDWKHEIREAIKEAYGVVLCLSKESEARKTSGLYPEALDVIAAYREYRPGSIFLIPVRLSACQIPPIEIDANRTLERIQYVNLFPPGERAENVKKLIEAIRSAPHHPARSTAKL